MTKWRAITLTPAVVAAAGIIAVACRDAVAPLRESDIEPMAGQSPPPKKDDEPRPSRFRLTGGGRVDRHDDHAEFEKNTPESHDFATFGFQARPTGINTTEGSGNFTWVEHNPDEFEGGFSFHGRVTFFTEPVDGSSTDECGRFGGDGRARTRDGGEHNVSFVVEHACDVSEPGRGNDHISVRINFSTMMYTRDQVLSGGNIQKHRLTGSGS
jgi:hypothetical protein